MKNKGIAAILAATMLTTVVAGCSNSSVSIADDTKSTKSVTEETTKSEKPVNEESSVTSATGNSSNSEISTVSEKEDSTNEESTAADSNADNGAEAATADVFCFFQLIMKRTNFLSSILIWRIMAGNTRKMGIKIQLRLASI